MPVQKQNFPIPFTGGVDTKTDPKQVLAGNLLTLENGLFTSPGQITKRTGYNALGMKVEGQTADISSAQAIQDYNNESLLFDGTFIYSYLQETGNWVEKGVAVSVINTDSQITRLNTAQQLNPDVAYLAGTSSGLEVYIYEDSRNGGSVRYVVKDNITGAITVADTSVASSSSKPKAIAFGGLIYLFYVSGSDVMYQTINPATPTVISSANTLISDGYTGFAYDVMTMGSTLYFGYLSSAIASGEIKFNTYSTSMSLGTSVVVATGSNAINHSAVCFSITVSADTVNSRAWISWASTTVQTSAYNSTLGTQVLAPTLVFSGNCTTLTSIWNQATSQMLIVGETPNATSYNEFITCYQVSYSGFTNLIGSMLSVGLVSKAFSANGNYYVNIAYDSSSSSTNQQCTYFTALLYQTSKGFAPTGFGSIIGKIASGVGGGLRTNSMLSEVPAISTNIFKFANLVKGSVLSEASTIFSVLGVNSTQMDFENLNKFLAVTFSNNLLIVGGILQSYDGVSVVEQGFHVYPEPVVVTCTGSGGGLSTGTYSYCACYAWTDNYGQVQRSAPSPIVVVSATANNQGNITVPCLRLTAKQTGYNSRDNVIIEIYRTSANASGVNPIFNLVTSTLAPLVNQANSNTVSFTDLESDASIASNPFLYTTGGVLDNIAPPSNSLITLYQDRVILGGLEDPNILWYSQNRTEIDNFNTTPVEFAAENTIGVDPRGGGITALGLLNQNLIIFKKTAIFVINGDGPNNTGGGQTFPDAQMIASDVGCTNPNSVIICPAGLMFQSDKGIYQLDQSFNLTYVGAKIESYNDLTITSSTLVPDKNIIIFTTNDDGYGTALVYDYYVGQWSTWLNHYAIDSIIFQDLFCFVTASGEFFQSNLNSYTDAGTPIYLSWVTPNLSFGQLNGFQQVFRCYLLGTYQGTHSLTISVAYDFNPSYTQTATLTPSAPTSPWLPYEYRIDFNIQRCTAIRLMVSDAETSAYNQGYSISALTFEVGVLPDGNRLPASNIYGTQ